MRMLVFLVIAVIFPGSLQAQEKTVALATLTDFAPLCFNKPDSPEHNREIIPPGGDSSRLQGYSWDVVRESFHELGYTIELYVLPWARVMHYLKSDRVDAVFPANKTEERDKHFKYSQEYVDRIDMVAYAPVDSNISWNGLSSLNGLKVGAVREWAYGKRWERNRDIKKELLDTIFQSFQVMEKGRLDAVVGYEATYDHVLKTHGIAEKFQKVGYFDRIDEYLMTKKDNSAVLQIINDFDRGYRLVRRRGGLEAISRKWQ